MIHTKRPRLISGASFLSNAAVVRRAEFALDIADDEAWMSRDAPYCLQSFFVIGIVAGILQRVLRRDEPPHPIELEPLQRIKRHGDMAAMRRVERAAEQPDALPGAEGRNHAEAGVMAGSGPCRGFDT